MSAKPKRLPIYISRHEPQGDVYESDAYETDGPNYAEQFMASFLGEVMHELKGRPNQEPSNRPPPNHMPARPDGPTSEGEYAGPYDNPYSMGMGLPRKRVPRWRRSVIMITTSSSGLIVLAHLTRRGVIWIIVIMFLVFLGLMNFPTLWEFIFAFL